MFLKTLAIILPNMEAKEMGILKEMEKIMLLSRKRERNIHVNIVQKKAMMKTTIGNYMHK